MQPVHSTLSLLMLGAVMSSFAHSAEPPKRPNIIFLMDDQRRWDALGVLNPERPLPELLHKAGYQTAGFGKTHWGVPCSTRGFEVRYESELPETGAVMMKNHSPEAKSRYHYKYHRREATKKPDRENPAGLEGSHQMARQITWPG